MPSHDDPPPSPGLRRLAWVLVISMSVLLVLALLGVIWGFVHQTRILMAARHAAAAPPAAGVHLVLAPGTRVTAAETQQGRLVLHLITPAGTEVDTFDPASGKLLQQIRTPK